MAKEVIGKFFTKYEKAAKYAGQLSDGKHLVVIAKITTPRTEGWLVFKEDQILERI